MVGHPSTQPNTHVAKGLAPPRFHKMKPECRQPQKDHIPSSPGAPSSPGPVVTGRGRRCPGWSVDRALAGCEARGPWDRPPVQSVLLERLPRKGARTPARSLLGNHMSPRQTHDVDVEKDTQLNRTSEDCTQCSHPRRLSTSVGTPPAPPGGRSLHPSLHETAGCNPQAHSHEPTSGPFPKCLTYCSIYAFFDRCTCKLCACVLFFMCCPLTLLFPPPPRPSLPQVAEQRLSGTCVGAGREGRALSCLAPFFQHVACLRNSSC